MKYKYYIDISNANRYKHILGILQKKDSDFSIEFVTSEIFSSRK